MTPTPSILNHPRWAALSAKRQEELLEKYRDSCDYDWWDFVYEDFKETMTAKGVEVTDITFSGFWSQGDGAAFAGYIRDWAPTVRDAGYLLCYPRLMENDWSFSSYLQNDNNMRFSGDMSFGDVNPYDEDDELLQFTLFELRQIPESVVDAIELTAQQMFEDAADELYDDLEAEYDHLTSDESTVEYILDNLTDEELKDVEEEETDEVPA